jgi:glycosidase
MPLIYSGQEAAMNKRLKFFEKDPIEWGDIPKQAFYTTLLQLKKDNPALWNGIAGGPLERLSSDQQEAVYAFARSQGDNTVITVLNLSDQPQEATIQMGEHAGNYTNVFANSTSVVTAKMDVNLNPWGYMVLTSNQAN